MSPNEKGSDTDVNTNSVLPYISARKKNNGLKEFLPYTKNKIQKNSLTWNKIGDGGAGLAYYHPYDYLVDSINVVVLYPKPKMNPYIGLFLSTLLSMYKDVFNHGHTLSKRRFNTAKIKVPVTPQKSLNWDYMEQYIVNIMKIVEVPKLEPIKPNRIDLNDTNWTLMPISKIFESIKRGKRLTKGEHQPGTIPYISSTALNNGVNDYIAIPNKQYRSFTNFIGVNNSGSVGRAFYHEYTTIVSDHVTALIHRKLNKYNAPFLIACLEQSLHGNFSFNREITDNRFSRQKIMVPINVDGNIDWQFMEDYIKSISNSHLI
ncbi:hypothetical protein A5806_001666 [Enterococcus faecium]|uniref:restriction endonuclease subunit S n=1 Tax=Enterococcus faecium TaxID=1352 RepID=UPI000B3EBCA8|nr:restriction endonuclease subunit S [Enterococcus faecium]OUZ28928.1 hypothetical protein A5806_001666 [Enterococcus faecium]